MRVPRMRNLDGLGQGFEGNGVAAHGQGLLPSAISSVAAHGQQGVPPAVSFELPLTKRPIDPATKGARRLPGVVSPHP